MLPSIISKFARDRRRMLPPMSARPIVGKQGNKVFLKKAKILIEKGSARTVEFRLQRPMEYIKQE